MHMQYAEKVALEDREYRRVQRRPVTQKKGALSLDIKRILYEDDDDDDDEKVKKYIDALHRYANARNSIPEVPKMLAINPITPLPVVKPKKKKHDANVDVKAKVAEIKRSRQITARRPWQPYH